MSELASRILSGTPVWAMRTWRALPVLLSKRLVGLFGRLFVKTSCHNLPIIDCLGGGLPFPSKPW